MTDKGIGAPIVLPDGARAAACRVVRARLDEEAASKVLTVLGLITDPTERSDLPACPRCGAAAGGPCLEGAGRDRYQGIHKARLAIQGDPP